jgi:hypothetical protein
MVTFALQLQSSVVSIESKWIAILALYRNCLLTPVIDLCWHPNETWYNFKLDHTEKEIHNLELEKIGKIWNPTATWFRPSSSLI